MAVGARSGHDEPEDRPERLAKPSPGPGGSGGPGGGSRGAEGGAAGGPGGRADRGPGDHDVPAGGASGGGAGDGDEAADDDSSDGGAARKHRSFWKELPLLIGIALILALLIKTFLVQAFSIPSDSMMNTLQRGDRVLVDKLTPWFGSEPERGEVVVFHDPGGWLESAQTPEPNALQQFLSFIGLMPSAEEKDLIKRVIAVGGDTVECKDGGKVTVNGKELDETSYIHPGSTPCDDEPFGPIKVPEGRIWVMGDNRQNSLDSRYHQELPGSGTVSVDDVVGRAVVVAWPLGRWSTLPVPATFDQPGLNAAASAAVAPGALGLAGAVPVVLVRRRRLTAAQTPAQTTVPTTATAGAGTG
ncbi:signal peptidase I [Streptomyces formicae]|uniref:Signal peptidase I n=1 Tax=Streptomyces formicae TaxID=1616117 RepID=A0ABY3X313_9ACTN|nr:signal peptidase I [Streptomyces formicae]UNM16403.1 signal peptidase I [Streptomyces formicae]